jgi:hypothetical protein
MSNTYNSVTKLWVVTDTGDLQTSETTAIVTHVMFEPQAVSDDLVIEDGRGNTAIALKAGSVETACVNWRGEPGGDRFNGLKVETIDGGTAYIYLAKK